MKTKPEFFAFLFIAAFLFADTLAQGLPEIVINDADATTTIDLFAPSADFIDAGDAGFRLLNEVAICRADERSTIDLAAPADDFFDTSEADFRLPDEASICRADQRATIDLVAPPEEFFNPAPEFTDKFVYVALGDSYQSGEGAGNSIADTAGYLQAYENGSNYAQSNGQQDNTYTYDVDVPGVVSSGGNGCHRALQNYAKINKNKFHPEVKDEDIILIDLTCSGAKIESWEDSDGDAKPPIVGDMNSGQIASGSQVAQALSQLAAIGLSAGDVDLVTVGMGGNDAKFIGITYSCLAPNLIRKILAAYPSAPWSLESEFVLKLEKMSSCKEADKTMGINSEQAINDLLEKETWAQNILLSTFSEAQILQLNYPNILPAKEIAPQWCGGIGKADVGYARQRIEKINEKIREALDNTVSQLDIDKKDRLKLVDMEKSFGGNALCPSNDNLALANEIKESNFDIEIRRLLNLDGNGDQAARQLIDNISAHYKDYKNCMLMNSMTTFPIQICDENGKWAQLMDNGRELLRYIEDKKVIILGNLTKSPASDEDRVIRYDRSFGLFHPNAKGHVLAACNVLAAHKGSNPSIACSVSDSVITASTVNNNPITATPLNVLPGEKINLILRDFGPLSSVMLWVNSTPMSLGTFVADVQGIVDTQITLPEISPGVHTIIAEGQAANGAGIGQQFRVNYPGDPTSNSDYGIYLTGFAPNDGTDSEQIDIFYNDRIFATKTPDEDGGVFIEIPVFNQPKIDITAKSQTTNQEVTRTVDVITDTVAPELQFSFDQTKKDLVFTATDNLTPADNIILTDQNGVVTAQDHAGNTVKLTFNEKNRKQSLRARLKEISYNNNTVSLSSNQISFAWFYGYTPKIPAILNGLQSLPPIPANLPRSDTLKFLLQQAKTERQFLYHGNICQQQNQNPGIQEQKTQPKNLFGVKAP